MLEINMYCSAGERNGKEHTLWSPASTEHIRGMAKRRKRYDRRARTETMCCVAGRCSCGESCVILRFEALFTNWYL